MDAFAEKPLDSPAPESSTNVLEKPLLNRRALLVAILVILGAAICIYEGFIYSIPGRASDFAVYYAAGQVAAHGGNPYQQAEIGRELKDIGFDSGIQEYLYSSSFLLLIQPLLSLSLRQAHRVFVLLTCLAMGASILLLWRSVNHEEAGRLPLWSLVLPRSLSSCRRGTVPAALRRAPPALAPGIPPSRSDCSGPPRAHASPSAARPPLSRLIAVHLPDP